MKHAETLGSQSVCTQAEREGQAIRRLQSLACRHVGRPHAILWNTIARQNTLRECLMQTAFAKRFVKALRQASWFKGQRIADFLSRYYNPTSSSNRSKGNARRRIKRLGFN